jgi:MFS family permease
LELLLLHPIQPFVSLISLKKIRVILLTWLPPTVDGRRPVYLYTLPVFAMGSAGVAAAQSIPSLLFWRFFQSMGASIGPVIGAAVIGDIFKLEERGRAMGVSFAVGKR